MPDDQEREDPLERIATQLEKLPARLAAELKRPRPRKRPGMGALMDVQDQFAELTTGMTREERERLAELGRAERAEERAAWATRAAIVGSRRGRHQHDDARHLADRWLTAIVSDLRSIL